MVNIQGDCAYFKVYRLKDIKSIIDIFSLHSLNTKKYLDFIDFNKAYQLYTGTKKKSPELTNRLIDIKSGMNTSRTEFKRNKDFKITPY